MARLILIADDSPTIQRRAQRILEGEGYAVETVSNGVAAIKKLPQLHPALVLADVSMPGKDGYEVCEFVKTSNDLFHVPVLLVGSDLEPYDEPRGAEVKADGIIKKPFTPLDLIAVVSKYISAAEASAYQPAPPETQVESSAAEQPGVSHEAQGTETSPCAQELDSASPSPEAPIAQEPELAAVPLGSLPESGLERAPEPIPETLPQSFAEAHLAGPPGEEPGSSSEATHPTADPFPEFELGQTGRSTEEDIQQAEPSPVWMSPEPALEPLPEQTSEAGAASVEQAPEPAPESVPELVGIRRESNYEVSTEASQGAGVVALEQAPEAGVGTELEPPAGANPEAVFEVADEAAPLAAERAPESPSEPAPEPEVQSPEASSEAAPEAVNEDVHEVVSEGISAAVEPMPEFVSEAAPEADVASIEAIPETAPEARHDGVQEVVPEENSVAVEPTPEAIPEAAPEPVLSIPETTSETGPQVDIEPSAAVAGQGLVTPEPTAEPVPEVAPQPVSMGPEAIPETVSEDTAEKSVLDTSQSPGEPPAESIQEDTSDARLDKAELTPELASEAAPQFNLESSGFISEGSAPEAVPEFGSAVSEPLAEPAYEAAPGASLVGSGLTPETPQEDGLGVVAEPAEEHAPEPAAEQALASSEFISESSAPEFLPEISTATTEPLPIIYGAPEASPVSPELSPETPPVVVPEVGLVAEPGPQNLCEDPALAPLGERVARDGVLASRRGTGEGVQSGSITTDFASARLSTPRASPAIDPECVHLVVRKVVMRMAPPVLPLQQVEDLVRVIAQEIMAEFEEGS